VASNPRLCVPVLVGRLLGSSETDLDEVDGPRSSIQWHYCLQSFGGRQLKQTGRFALRRIRTAIEKEIVTVGSAYVTTGGNGAPAV
jgi:hypothetical protein